MEILIFTIQLERRALDTKNVAVRSSRITLDKVRAFLPSFTNVTDTIS